MLFSIDWLSVVYVLLFWSTVFAHESSPSLDQMPEHSLISKIAFYEYGLFSAF